MLWSFRGAVTFYDAFDYLLHIFFLGGEWGLLVPSWTTHWPSEYCCISLGHQSWKTLSSNETIEIETKRWSVIGWGGLYFPRDVVSGASGPWQVHFRCRCKVIWPEDASFQFPLSSAVLMRRLQVQLELRCVPKENHCAGLPTFSFFLEISLVFCLKQKCSWFVKLVRPLQTSFQVYLAWGVEFSF